MDKIYSVPITVDKHWTLSLGKESPILNIGYIFPSPTRKNLALHIEGVDDFNVTLVFYDTIEPKELIALVKPLINTEVNVTKLISDVTSKFTNVEVDYN